MSDTSFISLSDPQGWQNAEWRKRCFERWIEQYDRLGRFQKWVKAWRDFYDPRVMRFMAEQDVQWHYEAMYR